MLGLLDLSLDQVHVGLPDFENHVCFEHFNESLNEELSNESPVLLAVVRKAPVHFVLGLCEEFLHHCVRLLHFVNAHGVGIFGALNLAIHFLFFQVLLVAVQDLVLFFRNEGLLSLLAFCLCLGTNLGALSLGLSLKPLVHLARDLIGRGRLHFRLII